MFISISFINTSVYSQQLHDAASGFSVSTELSWGGSTYTDSQILQWWSVLCLVVNYYGV